VVSLNNYPMVSVLMITYNHELYIAQAIEGVLMQKVDFEMELVIGEDCSNDSTRAICENYASQYPDKIRLLPSDRNQGMMPNFLRTLDSCHGKYIAMCEGDDYWTDPLKIKKQVEVFESDPEVGLVHSDCNILYQETGRLIRSKNLANGINYSGFDNPYLGILIGEYAIFTCTVLAKKDLLLKSESDEIVSNLENLQGDLPRWLYISKHSKVEYINEPTATYRVINGSSSHQKDVLKRLQYQVSSKKIRKKFADRDNLPHEILKITNRMYYGSLISLLFYIGDLDKINSLKKDIRSQKIQVSYATLLKILFSMNGLIYKIIYRLHQLKLDRRSLISSYIVDN